MQDTVGIDVKRHFNLRHAAWRWSDVAQVKLAQRLVGRRALTLTLQHVNGYRVLVVFCSREGLVGLGRNRGVLLNQFGHDAAHGFNTQRQRRHVQQQHVAATTRQHFTLNRSTHGNGFIRVHVFAWLFTKEVFHRVLHFRHTGLTTDQNHVVNVVHAQASIFDGCAARLNRTADQVFYQAFKFGTGHFQCQVFRACGIHGDVWQVDVGLLAARQLDFCFFSRFFQALQSHHIFGQVYALLFFELINDVVNQALVKVFTTQERVTIGGQYFKLFVAINIGNFDNRNIESTTTQVINRDFTVALSGFVHTESQSGSGRLIDDAFYFQTSDAACIFGGLALAVVKVSRNGNHCFRNGFTQMCFSRLFHFAQDFSRHLWR